MTPFDHPDFDGHEEVLFCHDRASGLQAIIAVHDTRLGPALGGCRMQPYPDPTAALGDVLRLARAMTYKAALAGLDLGGGKSVILGDPARDKTPARLEAMGRFVEGLGGRYWVAEDAGIGVADVRVMARATRWAAGIERRRDPTGRWVDADPSPATAWGVFRGIEAALAVVYGDPALRGRRVAVQGLGQVGARLAAHLARAGARLWVCDRRARRAAVLARRLGAEVVAPEAIFTVPVDVFAPCALGGVIDARTAETLRCRIVAGAANNPLTDADVAERLAARGIVFVPDFAINAGGIVNIAAAAAGLDAAGVQRRIEAIGDTVRRILERAAAEGRTPLAVAEALARARLEAAQRNGPRTS
ncbi:MAG: leucine dehydrogenase [Gammaproteobacteria bacterium]|nr:MAG: leucine dehydrogenase [Gammaproteobacteria bacterium]